MLKFETTTLPPLHSVNDDNGEVVGYKESEDHLIIFRNYCVVGKLCQYQSLENDEWEEPIWVTGWEADELVRGHVKGWMRLSAIPGLTDQMTEILNKTSPFRS